MAANGVDGTDALATLIERLKRRRSAWNYFRPTSETQSTTVDQKQFNDERRMREGLYLLPGDDIRTTRHMEGNFIAQWHTSRSSTIAIQQLLPKHPNFPDRWCIEVDGVSVDKVEIYPDQDLLIVVSNGYVHHTHIFPVGIEVLNSVVGEIACSPQIRSLGASLLASQQGRFQETFPPLL